jgi:hypothetical protein
MRIRSSFLALVGILTLLALGAQPALAHEPRTFNGMHVEVGWVTEPPTTGVLNGVVLIAEDSNGKPLTKLDVSVQVSYPESGSTMQTMHLDESDDTPGTYSAAFIPTLPGAYHFHITGKAQNGSTVDQTFKPGHGLEEVGSASSIEFPNQVPDPGQLSAHQTSADARIAAARSSASSAKTLGYIGIGLGVLALILSAAGLARRRKVTA